MHNEQPPQYTTVSIQSGQLLSEDVFSSELEIAKKTNGWTPNGEDLQGSKLVSLTTHLPAQAPNKHFRSVCDFLDQKSSIYPPTLIRLATAISQRQRHMTSPHLEADANSGTAKIMPQFSQRKIKMTVFYVRWPVFLQWKRVVLLAEQAAFFSVGDAWVSSEPLGSVKA
jgi:hypothetical protein